MICRKLFLPRKSEKLAERIIKIIIRIAGVLSIWKMERPNKFGKMGQFARNKHSESIASSIQVIS